MRFQRISEREKERERGREGEGEGEREREINSSIIQISIAVSELIHKRRILTISKNVRIYKCLWQNSIILKDLFIDTACYCLSASPIKIPKLSRFHNLDKSNVIFPQLHTIAVNDARTSTLKVLFSRFTRKSRMYFFSVRMFFFLPFYFFFSFLEFKWFKAFLPRYTSHFYPLDTIREKKSYHMRRTNFT